MQFNRQLPVKYYVSYTLDTGTHIPHIEKTVCVPPGRSMLTTGTHILFHVQRELHFRYNTRVAMIGRVIQSKVSNKVLYGPKRLIQWYRSIFCGSIRFGCCLFATPH